MPLFVVWHGGRSCRAALCSFCAESSPRFAGHQYEEGDGAASMASQGFTLAFPLPWLWAPVSVHCSRTQKPRPTKDGLSYDAAFRHTLHRGEGNSPVAVVELGAQPGARVCLTGSCNLNRWAKHFGHIPVWRVARRKGLVLGLGPWLASRNCFAAALLCSVKHAVYLPSFLCPSALAQGVEKEKSAVETPGSCTGPQFSNICGVMWWWLWVC